MEVKITSEKDIVFDTEELPKVKEELNEIANKLDALQERDFFQDNENTFMKILGDAITSIDDLLDDIETLESQI
jgi:hypothetical protein